jgi:hypothetical protein
VNLLLPPTLVGLIVSSLCFSCKPRSESALNIRPGIEELLHFDANEAQDICSRDILIFYAGNAEGLGPVQFLPNLKHEFGNEFAAEFLVREAADESEYFYEIDKQARNLLSAITNQRENKSGGGISICQNTSIRRPGRVVLLTAIDGPNKFVRDRGNGSVEVLQRAADSDIRLREFTFTNNHWSEVEHPDWPTNLTSNPVRPLPPGERAELYFPEDLWALQAWLLDFLKNRGYQNGFDQTLFFLKAHGAQRTYTQDANGVALKDMIVPQGSATNSVFMFDHDTKKAPRGAVANYFLPLWSRRTICEVAAGSDLPKINSCMARLDRETTINPKTQSINATGDPLAGFTLGPGPWRGKVQGFFGANVIFGGGPTSTRERELSYLPFVKTLNRAYDISQPLHLDELNSITLRREQLGGLPEAYRFLGNGLALKKENDSQTVLRLIPGNTAASLVILDTCSMNLKPFLTAKEIPWMTGSKVPLAVLSNPLPLLAKAVDYGQLDAFQLSYLASLLSRADEANLNPREKAKVDRILEILQVDSKINGDEKNPFSRLSLTLFKCPPEQSDCHTYKPVKTIFAFEQAYLALRELRARLDAPLAAKELDYGSFHALATAFNDGLIRILSEQQESPPPDFYWGKRPKTITPTIATMSQNFNLRQSSRALTSDPKRMERILKLWSYYAEDVIRALETSSFKDEWYKLFENISLEQLILADLIAVREMIQHLLEQERSGGQKSAEMVVLVNAAVPALLQSYVHVTKAFRPALPGLHELADSWTPGETDVFQDRQDLETFLTVMRVASL